MSHAALVSDGLFWLSILMTLLLLMFLPPSSSPAPPSPWLASSSSSPRSSWRRQRRRDAREQLRAAQDMFAAAGSSFAERARAELAATGQNARRRSVETQNNLTPRERQITRLVAHGATNAETAAQN